MWLIVKHRRQIHQVLGEDLDILIADTRYGFIQPGFQMHPDVVEDVERRGDFKMVKVRTPKGWAWRKIRREVEIEKDAE